MGVRGQNGGFWVCWIHLDHPQVSHVSLYTCTTCTTNSCTQTALLWGCSWHQVASNQNFRFCRCGSGWSILYTWYTCTGPRGTPGDGLDEFSTLKNPHFDPSYIAVASKLWKLAFSVIGVRGWIGQMGPMVGPIVGGFKIKTFINKNVFIHQNKYFEGVWYF